MANTTNNTTNVANNAAEVAASENNAVNVVINKLTGAVVKAVYIQQFDEQNYKTLSLMLDKPLKVIRQNDAGLYEETTTQFLSLPVAAALSQISDDVMNYFISVKGAEIDNLKTALSGAKIDITQRLFTAGETADDITNDTDHDQWFSFIKNVKLSKIAQLTMAKQLGLSIEDLKMLLED